MMATYHQIQNWVKKNHGYVPKTCWIAHVKEISGLSPRTAQNRQDPKKRTNPCPSQKQDAILAALRHFGELPG